MGVFTALSLACVSALFSYTREEAGERKSTRVKESANQPLDAWCRQTYVLPEMSLCWKDLAAHGVACLLDSGPASCAPKGGHEDVSKLPSSIRGDGPTHRRARLGLQREKRVERDILDVALLSEGVEVHDGTSRFLCLPSV